LLLLLGLWLGADGRAQRLYSVSDLGIDVGDEELLRLSRITDNGLISGTVRSATKGLRAFLIDNGKVHTIDVALVRTKHR
jgi:hypothetical protein